MQVQHNKFAGAGFQFVVPTYGLPRAGGALDWRTWHLDSRVIDVPIRTVIGWRLAMNPDFCLGFRCSTNSSPNGALLRTKSE